MVTIYDSENTWGSWRLGRKEPYGVGGFRTSDCIGAGMGEGGGGWGGGAEGTRKLFSRFHHHHHHHHHVPPHDLAKTNCMI